jgi:hypothetical protein
MDIVQIVVIISLLSVSTIIVISGIYLIGLIKEIKIITTKANSVVDSIARPVSSISDFIIGFKNGLKVFNTFFKDKKNE